MLSFNRRVSMKKRLTNTNEFFYQLKLGEKLLAGYNNGEVQNYLISSYSRK
jgi:hypothetical protein